MLSLLVLWRLVLPLLAVPLPVLPLPLLSLLVLLLLISWLLVSPPSVPALLVGLGLPLRPLLAREEQLRA